VASTLDGMSEGVQVSVGQIWADADPRSAGRKIRITEVGDGWARGEIISVERNVSQKVVGRTTRKISFKRFRPHNRGYRLMANPDTGTSVGG
jgi:hypothetical protein